MLQRIFATAILACTITAAAQKPQLVVLDTDIGDDIDDAFALSLILKSPELKLLSVVTAFGDTELRAHMAKRMLATAGRPDIAVNVGVRTDAKTAFTQAEYAKGDTHTVSHVENGVDKMLRMARTYPGQVTLIAIGPLINIGYAIDRDPAAFKKFKQVVVMGGSIRRGYGGRNASPAPEWNTRNSIEQTRKLLATGIPVYLFPLDSTQVVLPQSFKDALAASDKPLNRDLAEITKQGKRAEVKLYDAVAVSHLLEPSLCPVQPMRIMVDDKGFTREESGKPNAQVCLMSDEPRFLQLLENRLLKRPGGKSNAR